VDRRRERRVDRRGERRVESRVDRRGVRRVERRGERGAWSRGGGYRGRGIECMHCKSGSHKNGIRKSSRRTYNHIMGI
jgi:hypothetical protein